MLKCECGKEFESYRQLNGHKSSHSRGDTYKTGRRKTEIKTYKCNYCKKESLTKIKIFCCNQCQGNYKWQQTKEKIDAGIHPANKKYILEKFGNICAICALNNTWNGKELVLQLDHIDGNSDNNSVSNLRILCPNCHTQTETFCTKGGSKITKITKRNMYLRKYQSPEIIGLRTAPEADRNSESL